MTDSTEQELKRLREVEKVFKKICEFERKKWTQAYYKYVVQNESFKELTEEEKKLIKDLSPAPKCSHDPSSVIDHSEHWQCGKCGLIAKKITVAF